MDDGKAGAGGRFRAGVAVEDITPPVGTMLSGGAFGPSTRVHQPLQARAFYAERAGVRLLAISCDLLGFDWDLGLRIRRAIQDAHGVPVGGILLAGTHTHGGPATVTLRNWGGRDDAYRRWLPGRIVRAAGAAIASARPARVGAGVIECPGVAVNRTFGAEGSTNDSLRVVRVDGDDARPVCILLNYACHPVNLHSTGWLTPDFPCFVERDIHAGLGASPPVLYLLGACGDLNPANFPGDRSEALAAETGGKIAAKAMDLLRSIRPAVPTAVGATTRKVRVSLQPLPDRRELEAIREERRAKMLREADPSPTNWAYTSHRAHVEWATEALRVLESGRCESELEVEVQGLRLGDAGAVAVPGELFTEFGVAVGRSGILPHAFVVTQANGSFGYFPSRRAYEKKSYEAVACPKFLGLYLFDPSVGERIRDGCLAVLKDLAGA